MDVVVAGDVAWVKAGVVRGLDEAGVRVAVVEVDVAGAVLVADACVLASPGRSVAHHCVRPSDHLVRHAEVECRVFRRLCAAPQQNRNRWRLAVVYLGSFSASTPKTMPAMFTLR